MSEFSTTPTNTTIPDHRQCRYLKMDGVRCGKQIPLGHVFCHHHRLNRSPSFVKHNGKIRVPLLEDVSALQVTTTAAVHALLNNSLDRRDVRTVLQAVNAAAGVLRLDLAEKRWLARTGQTRPEPVTDFAVMGHERVAPEDPLPAATAPDPVTCTPPPVTCNLSPVTCHLPPVTCTPPSSLDPEDDFLTPETFLPFDEKMRVPLPAPGEPDPLRIDGVDWPCPYRFNYCQGPGPKASCHYCMGQMRWEDVHPGEPDPGAPGPLPTVDLDWTTIAARRDIAAPRPPAQKMAPPIVEPPSHRLVAPLALPAPQPQPPSECEPEWIYESEPDSHPESNLVPVLVACAEEQLPAPAPVSRPPAPSSRLPAPRTTITAPATSL
ncbi:MAG: hypothetical protein WBW84_24175 [Acidobacteriaceae bacterium]